MKPESPRLSATGEIGAAFRALARPPLLSLLLLNCMISVVAIGISVGLGPKSSDDLVLLGQISTYVLDAIGIYVQIAVVLAASAVAAEHSADLWLRAAFRHRCFWRFLGGTILEVVLVLLGTAALIVGAFVVGGIVALTQAAVILERKMPVDALRRSAELTSPVRRQVATVFSLLLLTPLVAGAAAVALELDLNVGAQLTLTIAGSVLSIGAAVALTHIFVKLGGTPAPPVQTLLYKGTTRPR